MTTFNLDRGGDPAAEVTRLVRSLDSDTRLGLRLPYMSVRKEFDAQVASQLGITLGRARTLVATAIDEWYEENARQVREILRGRTPTIDDAPEPGDMSYRDLHAESSSYALDSTTRAIACLKGLTYMESLDWLRATRRDVAGDDEDVLLSKVLERGGLSLRMLNLGGGAADAEIRTLAKCEDGGTPVDMRNLESHHAPVPLGDDVDRLEVLSNVADDGGLPGYGTLEGPALVAARRAHILAKDAKVNVGPFDETFKGNWLEAVRNGHDYVRTLAQDQERLRLLASRAQWIASHDRRIREAREREAKQLERDAKEATARAEEAARHLQSRAPRDL
jgi:hypothetical protein